MAGFAFGQIETPQLRLKSEAEATIVMDTMKVVVWDTATSSWSNYVTSVFSTENNIQTQIFSNWDDSTSSWSIYIKKATYRDVNGNDTLTIDSSCHNSFYYPFTKTITYYDADGNDTLAASFLFNYSTWENESKDVMYPDDNGNDTLVIYYIWQNNAWDEYKRTTIYYDAEGRDTLSINEYNKTITTYTSDEEYISYIYNWDCYVNTWEQQASTKEEQIFVSDTRIEATSYTWSDTDQDWVYRNYLTKTILIFHAENEDPGTTPGNTDIKIHETTAGIAIAPNSISLESGVLEVYNIQGSKVMSHKVSENETISLDILKQGIYIYSVYLDGKTLTGKIVRQ